MFSYLSSSIVQTIILAKAKSIRTKYAELETDKVLHKDAFNLFIRKSLFNSSKHVIISK